MSTQARGVSNDEVTSFLCFMAKHFEAMIEKNEKMKDHTGKWVKGFDGLIRLSLIHI